MRVHIALAEALAAEFARRRLEDERRWDDVVSARGVLAGSPHEWDEDPAEWVRAQRRGGTRAG